MTDELDETQDESILVIDGDAVEEEAKPTRMEEISAWPVLTYDSSPDDVVMILQGVDPNKPLLAGRDITKCPTYTTQYVAETFFQRTSHWMRSLERDGRTVSDRTGRKVTPELDNWGRRHYSLADIEDLAHVLVQNGVISISKLHITLQLIHLIAMGYGVIPVE